MARPARKPPRARHHDTTWRPVETTLGNDAWQRQADAAAWSAISGIHPSLYLGAIEPIPIPHDLRAKLRAAGEALAAEPSAQRADTLLRLAHRAVYGNDAPEPTPDCATLPKEAPAGDWWSDIPAEPQDAASALPSATAMMQFAAEALEALSAQPHEPADYGEASPPGESTGESNQWWNE
jgi:hypothetical protein